MRSAPTSFGLRPGLGCKDTFRRVQRMLDEGWRRVVDAGVGRYFDAALDDCLITEVEEKLNDGRLPALPRPRNPGFATG